MSRSSSPAPWEIDVLIQGYCRAEEKVYEQHGFLHSKQVLLQEKQMEAADQIRRTFEQVRDVLSQQEAHLLNGLTEMVKPDDDSLAKISNEIGKTRTVLKAKKRVAELMKAGDLAAEEVSVADMKDIQEAIELIILNIDFEIQKAIVCPRFSPDEETLSLVRNANYGKVIDSLVNTDNVISPTEQGSDVSYDAHLQPEGGTELKTLAANSPTEEEDIMSQLSGVNIRLKAPSLQQSLADPGFHRLSDDQEEPPPPSYWQAVGLTTPGYGYRATDIN